MTWTRLDDGWTDRPILAQLPYEVRWHYLALIQFCSRTGRYDGRLRVGDARRCSDVDDPDAATEALTDVGLLVAEPSGFLLPLIEDHIPPPHMRDEKRKAQQRDDTRRHRAHRAGDHSLCTPGRCKALSTDASAYTGTGRDGDGTGRETQPRREGEQEREEQHSDPDEVDEQAAWPEVRPPNALWSTSNDRRTA